MNILRCSWTVQQPINETSYVFKNANDEGDNLDINIASASYFTEERLNKLDCLIKKNPERILFHLKINMEMIRIPRTRQPLESTFRYYIICYKNELGSGKISSVFKAYKFIPSDNLTLKASLSVREYAAKITRFATPYYRSYCKKSCVAQEEEIVQHIPYLRV